MKTLQAYEVTKGSTDGTFLVGETADFQMIESKDYSVVFNGRSEQLVKRER